MREMGSQSMRPPMNRWSVVDRGMPSQAMRLHASLSLGCTHVHTRLSLGHTPARARLGLGRVPAPAWADLYARACLGRAHALLGHACRLGPLLILSSSLCVAGPAGLRAVVPPSLRIFRLLVMSSSS